MSIFLQKPDMRHRIKSISAYSQRQEVEVEPKTSEFDQDLVKLDERELRRLRRNFGPVLRQDLRPLRFPSVFRAARHGKGREQTRYISKRRSSPKT